MKMVHGLMKKSDLKCVLMNCENYEDCIEASLHCAAVCHRYANTALQHERITECIRLNLECAAICTAAGTLMNFESKHSEKMCKICIEVCEKCAQECEKHDNAFYQECARACRECAKECRKCYSVKLQN